MPKAIWNGTVIAESNDTVVVEGNHYFPISAVKGEYFEPSTHVSTCAWKGEARYHHVVVDGQRNRDAAWYYPDPTPAARNITGRVAFWNGVRVED